MTINHKELAKSRLATEYSESANLIAYIKALLVEADTLEGVIQDVIDKRWIDTATGVNLDIIGAIVGQPRNLIDAAVLFYFGFAVNPGSQSLGKISDPSIGGRFRSILESTVGDRELTDEEYRLFIRARIIKNSITPTNPAMSSFLRFMFSAEQVLIIDGPMFYTVEIGKRLTANEKVFLLNTDLVPKVAGVGVGYLEYNAAKAFGFTGVATSLGFGSVQDSNIGGEFASIIK